MWVSGLCGLGGNLCFAEADGDADFGQVGGFLGGDHIHPADQQLGVGGMERVDRLRDFFLRLVEARGDGRLAIRRRAGRLLGWTRKPSRRS